MFDIDFAWLLHAQNAANLPGGNEKRHLPEPHCEWCFKIIFWRILSKWQFSHNPNRNPSRYGIFTKKKQVLKMNLSFCMSFRRCENLPWRKSQSPRPGGVSFFGPKSRLTVAVRKLGVHFYVFTLSTCFLYIYIY